MHSKKRYASLCALLLGLVFGTAGTADAKTAVAPAHVTAAPLVTTINGDPLQVHVGDDMSFQVFNSQVPGSGQIYPTGATDTADMGWFVRTSDTLYAPNFGEHPSGTATSGIGTYTAFTPVSLSGVTGSGTTAAPYRVDVSGTLGSSGITAHLQVLYVNGQNYFTKIFTLNNGAAAQSVTVFLGADIYLASSDAGVPFLETNSGSPGGQDCGSPPTYTILLIPQSVPDAHSGRSYNTVWGEIGAGTLDNTIDTNCEDNGAALQWNRNLAAGGSLVLQAATSFGEIPAITQFNITSVTPNLGAPGSSVDVQITGIGFIGGTTFDFGAGLSVTNLVIDDVNTAHATVVISAGATPGPRDVVATQGQPDNAEQGALPTATLVDGFTVTGGVPPPPVGAISTPALNTWGLLALLTVLLVMGAAARRRT